MDPQVFSAAKEVDQAFIFILAIAVGILVLVTALMVYFTWRYHHTRNPEPTDIHGSLTLEILWTAIPTVLVMAMFWFGWTSFKAMRNAPQDAMRVTVEGRMWSWAFTYENGKRSPILMAPVDTPVLLEMTSTDVIHSFYVPAMRIKMDTVPGMTTTAWFESDSPGEFDVLCAEYCGLKHANMITTLRVVGQDEFDAWLAGKGDEQKKAAALFADYGCTSCHSLDGSDGVGPSLAGLGGRTVRVTLPDGSEAEVLSDEAYLRRAVHDPGAEVVKGYPPAMPTYGEDAIPKDDLDAMINWMIHGETEGPPPGRELAEAEGCISCHSTDGSYVAGPSFKDLYGAERTVVDERGATTTVTADEDYLRASIREPGELLVEGEDPIMPPYAALSEDEVQLLVDYIRSLSDAGGAGNGDAAAGADPVATGMEALQAEGCLSCHTTDGSESMGPTFKGLAGSVRTAEDGSETVADAPYLRESIVEPKAFLVQGYPPMMPPSASLDDETLDAIVAAIQSLEGDGK